VQTDETATNTVGSLSADKLANHCSGYIDITYTLQHQVSLVLVSVFDSDPFTIRFCRLSVDEVFKALLPSNAHCFDPIPAGLHACQAMLFFQGSFYIVAKPCNNQIASQKA
jgi:hypothetical protein